LQSKRIASSIAARALLATIVAILFSMGVSGYAMYTAYERSTFEEAQGRLRSNINMMLSAVLARSSALDMPQNLPEPRLSTPGSGLYAFIENGARQVVWNSRSAILGKIDKVPTPPDIGQQVFSSAPEILLTGDDKPRKLYVMGITILWDYGENVVEPYTFWAMEEYSIYQKKLDAFLQRLLFWLGVGAIALLAVQVTLWWWVYRPLKRLAKEIHAVEKGSQLLLSDKHPLELSPIVDNLNTLLDFQQRRITRSRNTLQDLAHSLKTPLAVLRNTVSSNPSIEQLSTTVNNEIERMNQTVSYQLQKAATAGQSALLAPLLIKPLVDKIINTLKKVYADKNLEYRVDIEAKLALRADEGDMYELLGNILDNASKWSKSIVSISVSTNDKLIRFNIEDDGSGISDENKKIVLDRGTRADQTVPGHGVGMAIVKDIIEEGYGGMLYLYDSSLGGANIVIDLPNKYH
jgi:two-component system sensor histidine kinase PhoQ